ncbi:hypothetical protein [Comamonas terrigena]|uniref:hypothetical protein n=1 Tax=Comamonas terrigena TaxID=32013 RepID=UPI00289CB498|nr:hypothetical protein [Comamonas terrigena]
MEFRKFTAESLEATSKQWLKLANKVNAFSPDVEQLLEWVKEHIDIKENAIAYGVFPEGSDIAIGVCELIITRKSAKTGWVKFIRLRLDPQVDANIFANNSEGVVAAIEAYVACVAGVLAVKDLHKADTIKVFGRTQEQMQFLTLLSAALQKRDEAKFTTKIEGRWLVLKWSNEK